MKLCTIVCDPDQYTDRLKSIDYVGTKADRNVVICQRVHREIYNRFPHTEFIAPEEDSVTGGRYFYWAAKKAHATSRAGGWIVTEVPSGITLSLMRIALRSQATLIPQLATPAEHVWKERSWCRDTFAPADMRQKLAWRRKVFQQICALRLSIRTCDGIIANSHQIASEVQQQRPNAQVVVIKNCVTSSRPTSPGSPDNTEPRFLFASGLQPYKGVGVLFESWRRYLDAGGMGRLVIAGKAAECDHRWLSRLLDEYSDVLSNVDLLGYASRAELVDLYHSSNALLVTSFHEGSPRVVYEALANGLPVIASNIPAIQEFEVESGWLRSFPVASPSALCQLLLDQSWVSSRSTHEKRRMAIRTSQRYSPSQRGKELIEFFHPFVQRNRFSVSRP